MTTKANPGPWTDDENAAICHLYFTMLDTATTAPGAKFKAHMIRAAQGTPKPGDYDHTGDASDYAGKLAERSKGSIEAKLMNCSAAHRDLRAGAETMDGYGYRCLSNYQGTLRTAMQSALAGNDVIDMIVNGRKEPAA